MKRTILKQDVCWPTRWVIESFDTERDEWRKCMSLPFKATIDGDPEILAGFAYRSYKDSYWDCALAFETLESGLKMLKACRAEYREATFRLIEATSSFTHTQIEEGE